MKLSAGILVYKKTTEGLKFFLVHPGGPFFMHRDNGAWSIPKGEYMDGEGGSSSRQSGLRPREGGEEALAAAKREFKEETGFEPPIAGPDGGLLPLSPVKYKNGKVVSAWAIESDLDASKIKSNVFKIFGKEFPEVDRAEWFTLSEARVKINPAQVGFLEELEKIV